MWSKTNFIPERTVEMFVGYATLSGLLREITLADLIYVGLIEEAQTTEVGSWTIEAIVSSPVFRGKAEIVRYCAIPIGRTVCFAGEPLPENRERLTRRAESGLEAIKSILKNRGLEFRAAIVLMPRDLRIMRGEADLLAYEKEGDLFRAK